MNVSRIRVAGFRSLRDVSLELTPITVLIGANGAGKSNLLWALEMVRMLAFESLQLFVGERGGATYLLHYGPQQTAAIDLELDFSAPGGEHAYRARLGYGANESLIFLLEQAGCRKDPQDAWSWSALGAGHQESKLGQSAGTDETARMVQGYLRQINFYHFHDTSRRSPLRTRDFADVGGRTGPAGFPEGLLGLVFGLLGRFFDLVPGLMSLLFRPIRCLFHLFAHRVTDFRRGLGDLVTHFRSFFFKCLGHWESLARKDVDLGNCIECRVG